MNYDNIISHSHNLVNIISNSNDVEFILDLPLIYNSINFIVGDSGCGKTILNQCIINSILKKCDDHVIVWLDCEFQSSISKQRGISNLIKEYLNNLLYIDVENYIINHNLEINKKIEKIRNVEKETDKNDKNEKRKKSEEINILMKEKIENSVDFVLRISESVCDKNRDKKVIFVIDSFEDIVENTSDDIRIKSFLRSLLIFCSQNATYIISHHIGKKQDITDSMKFRGSMVIKNKCASMLLLKEKKKETEETKKVEDNDNDNEVSNYIYNVEILKLRAYALFSRNFCIYVELGDKGNFRIKSVEKNYDLKTRIVIREAYFLLSKPPMQMQKTELMINIQKNAKISKEKVRSIIENYNDLFVISTNNIFNKQIYSLNFHKMDQICLIAGIPENERKFKVSEEKKQLIKILDSVPEDKELNIEIKDGSRCLIYGKKAAIINNIFSIKNEHVNEIMKKIKETVSPF